MYGRCLDYLALAGAMFVTLLLGLIQQGYVSIVHRGLVTPPVTANAPNVTTARRRLHNLEPQTATSIGAARNSYKPLL